MEAGMVRNASAEVIRISENNPHYFTYRGKELLLITSAEHYGGVIDKKFDYKNYFNILQRYGLNYTRIYPGAMVLYKNIFRWENNMSPEPGDLLVPWARSSVPGYIGGGNKFDLNQWDPEYFKRLDDFITCAAEKDIIVEMCFFNCQYEKSWPYSPLHKDANVQGIGVCDFKAVQTTDDQPLYREQLKFIGKLMEHTNRFDNLIYEFVDEPTLFFTPVRKVQEWIDGMIVKAVEVESSLPKKHLLAQMVETGVDYSGDDRVSVITSQYCHLTNSREVGGMDALACFYPLNKPIELNETAHLPGWQIPYDEVASSRMEAWEFMVGGGAAFNQLNGYFCTANPTGENGCNKRILENLKCLRVFLEGFDFVKMKRSVAGFINEVSTPAYITAMSQPGRQYALYLHHGHSRQGGTHPGGSLYIPYFGSYETEIKLMMEKGDYKVSFFDPENLNHLGEQQLSSDGGETWLKCPRFTLDIAIKITAV